MANPSSMSRRRTACTILPTAAPAVVLAALMAGAAATPAWAEQKAKPAPACTLRAADLVALAKRFAGFRDDLPAAVQLGVEEILAYEEHRHFVYVRGRGPSGDRRIVFCKPGTFVVDDRPAAAGRPWRLVCTNAPKITERRFQVTEGDAAVTGQALLPDGAVVKAAAHVVETARNGAAATARFIHVLHVGDKDAAAPKTTLAEKDGTVTLKLSAGDRTFTLVLPAEANEPGTIAVSQADGKALLPQRLLPAGVMPHGAKGVRRLEGWDGVYRRKRPAPWDVGRASSKLEAAIKDGTIRPGRAVELGCGTGTNAVRLAQKGFDVTAIDIAPTCLTIARGKARKAGVKVRWLVADVLNLPALGEFDFIFDRGCYHGVRRVSATGYVKTVGALSKPGTLMLILAGNANEPRHYGPPRVDETDFVKDFAAAWDFVWLKETRLDSKDPKAKGGPWAWSVLLRRKARKR